VPGAETPGEAEVTHDDDGGGARHAGGTVDENAARELVGSEDELKRCLKVLSDVELAI